MGKFNQLANKELLQIYLSSIKTKVTIKFLFVFFSENRLGAERAKK